MLISKLCNHDIESNILKFETQYNITLPDDYKRFLVKYNGGYTPKTKIRVGRISSDIRGLFGYENNDPHLNILSFFKEPVLKDFLDMGFIPIGTNVFGDYFLICISKDNYGKIFFRYHDKKRNDIFVAENFSSFITKCKSEEVGHIPSIEERRALLISNGNGHLITPEKLAGWQAEIDRYKNIVQEKVIL